ncbi:Reverse transcriptase domain [Arabidopsis suecica]|uniref:Reverse transcriptase domain n=1 Tax=Arabidopsis suecica TaxID=45249 RepID=A0A8T1YPC8_ARASU|nr:Reverse transcriptase domain [Arabidopsis suecica]
MYGSNASRNAIRSLTLANGTILTRSEDIKAEAARHFRDFLQSEDPDFVETPPEFLSDLLDYRCSREQCLQLVAPVTEEEIKKALFSLPSGKASGPDGFSKEFYVAAWNIVGSDFVVAVQSFFQYGFMPKSVNATLLTLIPKNPDLSSPTMKDYRPVACCNMLYKVVSKILANCLKIILPDFIEPNQSAFVKGRLLLENVHLAAELVKDYHKDTLSPRSAIKFDISKSFDTVQWPFIVGIFRALGFPDLFINWIYVCISTAYFSVVVNGELEGFFASHRGVRQGCSLSPYIFVMVQNVLSRLLNKAAQTGRIGRHPRCDQVPVTHLSFADDILVFTDGSPGSLRETLRVFEEFAHISGLHINASKSALFAGGRNKQALIQEALVHGLQVENLPIRYLGLPLTTRSMTAHDYAPLSSDYRRDVLMRLSDYARLFYGREIQILQRELKFLGKIFVDQKLKGSRLEAFARCVAGFCVFTRLGQIWRKGIILELNRRLRAKETKSVSNQGMSVDRHPLVSLDTTRGPSKVSTV